MDAHNDSGVVIQTITLSNVVSMFIMRECVMGLAQLALVKIYGLPAPFLRGLCTAILPGRAQVFHDELDYGSEKPEIYNNSGDLIFYLDGAHSPESMEACARWFSNVTRDVPHSSHVNVGGIFLLVRVRLARNGLSVRGAINFADSFVQLHGRVHFSKALFVPSISKYHKIDSGASTISSDISQDVSWQFNLQRVWEKLIYGKGDVTIDGCFDSEKSATFSSMGLLSGDPSQNCDPSNQKFTNSAVIPSLPSTVKLLRDCVRENPTLRLQVLVTGSLHLVGDVLRLLKR